MKARITADRVEDIFGGFSFALHYVVLTGLLAETFHLLTKSW